MGTTDALALRYPELTSVPDGAAQIKALADDVEAYLPRGEWATASKTSTQTTITTEANLSSLTLTWTPSGSRKYLLQAFVQFSSSVGSDHVGLYICTSADAHLDEAEAYLPVTATRKVKVCGAAIVTPTDGVSVTYKLRAARVAGSGNITQEGAAASPALFIATDIGPA